MKTPVVMSWSSGKDSAITLYGFPLAAMLLSDLVLSYFVYGGKSMLHS